MGNIKAVLFDLGGTLIKTVDTPEIHRRILKACGVEIACEDVAKAHEENQKEYDVQEMARLGQEYWIKWNSKLLEKLGIHENREFLAQKINELWFKYAELEAYPDVIETLTQLKAKGAKLGVITNALQHEHTYILKKLGLTDYFDIVIGVDVCKKAKPDVAIFHYALEKLHVHPEETIFVGDSVEYDYEGARKAGLKPLIISREGRAPANVKIINNLTELLLYV